MSLPSLLNTPKSNEEWQRWSFSNANDHQKITQAIQQRTGNVTSVALTNGGSGYTSIPNVILDASGSGASFNIQGRGGVLTSITLQTGGEGYRSNLFEFSGGGGTGATAVITLNPVLTLTNYPMEPINFDVISEFFRRHAQAHTDMNGALGLQSVDLSEFDIKDENKLQAWIYSNYQEHNNIHERLGI